MKHADSCCTILKVIGRFYTVAFVLVMVVLSLCQSAAAQLSSATRTDIGLSQLRTANPGLTEGVGVKAHLVEAFSGDRYVPNESDSQLINNSLNNVGFPATGTLSEIYNGHALGSARHFFGSSGVARDVGTNGLSVNCYAASGKTTANEHAHRKLAGFIGF
jgi:hypothetical protein